MNPYTNENEEPVSIFQFFRHIVDVCRKYFLILPVQDDCVKLLYLENWGANIIDQASDIQVW